MTEGKFNSFIKSLLRSGTRRWPPKYEVLKEAFVGIRLNKKTNRKGRHFECNKCKGIFPQKEVEVNHIHPVIPLTGFDSWDGVIKRMFCPKEDMECLCKPCHKLVTKEENEQRRLKQAPIKKSNTVRRRAGESNSSKRKSSRSSNGNDSV